MTEPSRLSLRSTPLSELYSLFESAPVGQNTARRSETGGTRSEARKHTIRRTLSKSFGKCVQIVWKVCANKKTLPWLHFPKL